MALAVATLTEKPAGANHSFRSSLEVELTNLTELEVTCTKLVAIIICINYVTEKHQQEKFCLQVKEIKEVKIRLMSK